MPKYSNAQVLNLTYQALGDPTRRAVLARLTHGPFSVTELAEPFAMALPSFLQHVRVLESAGLVRSRKQGRTRVVSLNSERLRRAESWLEEQRTLWESRFDRFDAVINRLNENEDANED